MPGRPRHGSVEALCSEGTLRRTATGGWGLRLSRRRGSISATRVPVQRETEQAPGRTLTSQHLWGSWRCRLTCWVLATCPTMHVGRPRHFTRSQQADTHPLHLREVDTDEPRAAVDQRRLPVLTADRFRDCCLLVSTLQAVQFVIAAGAALRACIDRIASSVSNTCSDCCQLRAQPVQSNDAAPAMQQKVTCGICFLPLSLCSAPCSSASSS